MIIKVKKDTYFKEWGDVTPKDYKEMKRDELTAIIRAFKKALRNGKQVSNWGYSIKEVFDFLYEIEFKTNERPKYKNKEYLAKYVWVLDLTYVHVNFHTESNWLDGIEGK